MWVTDSVGGLVLLPEETAFIYYIICDCVQFDNTLMMVFMFGVIGFLKTA